MLIETRLEEILKIVNDKNSITVQELTDLLKISESTIRRDLTALHNEGKLKKVHGGATSLTMYRTKDQDIELRKNMNKEEKIQIVRYAAALIETDDFVYLDAGTTTDLLIDFITEKNAVYVTNAIGHAKKLSQKGCEAHLLGGRYKLMTEALVGNLTLDELERFNFTKGFFGTNGVTVKEGFTTPDIDEALVKKRAMQKCMESYILCDSAKFNRISPITFAEFQNATIITTKIKRKEYLQYKNIVEVKDE
ncbi:MAG: DeoR/GlpR family DNA-binding transcription regulator [Velocimicrobium sp.]